MTDTSAADKARAATDAVEPKAPRDVLVERIAGWVSSDDNVYGYADRLISDLYEAGFDITPLEDGMDFSTVFEDTADKLIEAVELLRVCKPFAFWNTEVTNTIAARRWRLLKVCGVPMPSDAELVED